MSLGLRLIRWALADALLAGIAFLCAGRLNSPNLKLYLVAFALTDLVSTVVINPDLARERSHPSSAGIDPAVRPLASLLFVVTVALGALDMGRIRWTLPLPKGVQVAALVVFIVSSALQIWAIAVNAFFSTELRIQAELGHRLVKNGPYRCIRHPGYLAMLLTVPATAIALGSRLALIPATLYAALILFRVEREDRYLLRNLPGYTDYMDGAPYRLIPGVW